MTRLYIQVHGDVTAEHKILSVSSESTPFHVVKFVALDDMEHEITFFPKDVVGLARQLRELADKLDPPALPPTTALAKLDVVPLDDEEAEEALLAGVVAA